MNPFVDYNEYINSDIWRKKAEYIKAKFDYRCQICYTKSRTLDAHHRTYDRLGNERDEDITVLCRDCHEIYHQSQLMAIPPTNRIEYRAPTTYWDYGLIEIFIDDFEDSVRDELHHRRVHGTLISFPGKTKFKIYNRNNEICIEDTYALSKTGDYTTGICEGLIGRLIVLVGFNNIFLDGSPIPDHIWVE